MLKGRAPWWMYVIAVVYILTIAFNARQEFWGPANTGWLPSWPSTRVAGVSRGKPMERAGLRVGDVVVAANRQPITGMPDWFVARAHFDQNQPIDLRIQRDGQPYSLRVVITEPVWRTWNTPQLLRVLAFYSVRFTLLLLAIFVGFRRPERPRARLVALMLAMGAVAEGYPSSGWAAALRHLPAVLAIPICLATASCVLSSFVWLAFFADFATPSVSQQWRRALVLVSAVIFGFPIVSSAIAMIYFPEILARPWPQVLSSAPVSWIQDIAGVFPLLFLNVLPAYRPGIHVGLLNVWFVVTILYFIAGLFILAAAWRRIANANERHRVAALCLAVLFFGAVAVQNVFERNWGNWFGSPLPRLLSTPVSVSMDFLFLLVPLTLVYYVLTENGQAAESSTRDAST